MSAQRTSKQAALAKEDEVMARQAQLQKVRDDLQNQLEVVTQQKLTAEAEKADMGLKLRRAVELSRTKVLQLQAKLKAAEAENAKMKSAPGYDPLAM